MKVLPDRLRVWSSRIVATIAFRAGSSPTQVKIRSAALTASLRVVATVALSAPSFWAWVVARLVVRL